MPWSRGPAGDGRSSFSRDPQRGGEPPSSATFLGGRDWEKRSLETAAPWNTGRVSRPISWGHCGETGTGWCSVHRSSPEGPALKSPGPLASGRSSHRLSSENDGPQIRLRPGRASPSPTRPPDPLLNPRYLNCLSSSGTRLQGHRHGHTPWRNVLQRGKIRSAPPFYC